MHNLDDELNPEVDEPHGIQAELSLYVDMPAPHCPAQVIPIHEPVEPPVILEQSLYVITDPAGHVHISAFPEMSVVEKSGTYINYDCRYV